MARRKTEPTAAAPVDPAGTTPLAALVHDPDNVRLHGSRNLTMIAESLRTTGAGRSVVLDEHNVILAGNGVVRAAPEAGISRVRIVDADGTELIAVRRHGLTPEQKRSLALFDNRTAELATWDFDKLADSKAAGLSLQPFWTAEEEAAMLAKQAAKVAGRTDPDDVPADRATDIQPGDLFQLGLHRLLCGDSGDRAGVARLMDGAKAVLCATDPPYGVDFSGAKYNPRAKSWAGIDGDKRQGGDLRTWLASLIAVWLEHIEPHAAYYFWSAPMLEGAAAAAAVIDAGLHIQGQIIWVKNALVLGQADYQWKHETCWYAFKKGAKHRWFGERDKTTVWEVSRVAHAAYVHPMQKPVELYAIPIRHHTHAGEVCFEPFSGSGSQIIAAEEAGRRCYAIEISPSYCQVAIDRWEAFSGQLAKKVGESSRP